MNPNSWGNCGCDKTSVKETMNRVGEESGARLRTVADSVERAREEEEIALFPGSPSSTRNVIHMTFDPT